MPFAVSAGVTVNEFDLTTVVPAVSTTEGATAGVFRWGPVDKILLIDSENVLVNRYGKPTNLNPETFFNCGSFLSYGNKLYVSRAANTTGFSNTVTGVAVQAGNNVLGNVDETDGVAAGMLVYGTFIPDGTRVVSVNSTAVVLTANATGTETAVVAFANPNTVFTAVANSGVVSNPLASYIVKNEDDFLTKTFESDVHFAARFPGELGNSLKVSVCDTANQFNSTVNLVSNTAYVNAGATSINFTIGANTANVIFTSANATITSGEIGNVASATVALLSVGDYLEVGNTTVGKQFLKITRIANVATTTGTVELGHYTLQFDEPYQLSTVVPSNSLARFWEFHSVVDAAPGQSTFMTSFGNSAANDEVHTVVVDQDGKFTGVPGTILEVWSALSRASDAKSPEGETIFYRDVLNNNSNYVWVGSDRSNAPTNTALFTTTSTNSKPMTLSFLGGSDGDGENVIAINNLTNAFDKFASAEEIDISLIMTGKARGGTHGEQLANYLIDNIAEKRLDCVVFLSPDKSDVVANAGRDESADIVQFRNVVRSTSYAVIDSGYKYMYDKYNDLYRWVPLNGDIAGLCVRTDDTRDPWWSPAGFNRGQIKNIIRLAYNPRKADRDILYKAGVNPVVSFPGQGTILYGDKTALNKPSAFDRINVRRLFIVLEKAIATAAKFTLFEFNDEFTRAQFRTLVEPFLRDVQGRRGIYDFKVVCDETNNPGSVIDRNEFVGDIYIKPARSINFITLNFVAVPTGIEFNEVVGKF